MTIFVPHYATQSNMSEIEERRWLLYNRDAAVAQICATQDSLIVPHGASYRLMKPHDGFQESS